MFRRLMEQVGDYVFFVDFYNWGEPLLNPHLEDFIRIARDYKISSFVSTNLSLRLSDARIERYNLSEQDSRAIVHWAPSDRKYRTHVVQPPRQKRCGWHYTAAAINWDGSVTPCSTASKKSDDFVTFGKSGEHAYFDVLNKPAFRAARDFLAIDDLVIVPDGRRRAALADQVVALR